MPEWIQIPQSSLILLWYSTSRERLGYMVPQTTKPQLKLVNKFAKIPKPYALTKIIISVLIRILDRNVCDRW